MDDHTHTHTFDIYKKFQNSFFIQSWIHHWIQVWVHTAIHKHICVHEWVHTHTCAQHIVSHTLYMYIYIYRERERDREGKMEVYRLMGPLVTRTCGVWGWRSGAMGKGWRSGAMGKGCVAVRYLTQYFRDFILPPRWLVDVMPCPRKSQKNYTKEKTATGKRRRRFFYTFLY